MPAIPFVRLSQIEMRYSGAFQFTFYLSISLCLSLKHTHTHTHTQAQAPQQRNEMNLRPDHEEQIQIQIRRERETPSTPATTIDNGGMNRIKSNHRSCCPDRCDAIKIKKKVN